MNRTLNTDLHRNAVLNWLSVVWCILLLSLSVYAKKDKIVSRFDSEIKQKSGVLDSIRLELEKGRTRIKELEKQEGNYLSRLEQIEKNISVSKMFLDMISLRIDTVESLIVHLKDSLSRAEQDLQYRQSIMRRRLHHAYISSNPLPLLHIVSVESPIALLRKIRYVRELNQYDRNLASIIDSTRNEIDEKRRSEEEEKERLAQLLASKKEEQTALLQEEASRKKMLKKIRSQKSEHLAMIKELEAAQEELNNFITLLEKKRKQAKSDQERQAIIAFEKRKGTLPWPVDGPVVAKFGKVVHPVYKTVIINNGIDIGAKHGDEVLCVAPGTVIHCGWMRGLGKLVIVDHAGGYITVYAHLEKINVTPDQEVRFGTVLGSVGESGSLGGTKLHFEIRKSADSLNPVEWLEKAKL